MKFFILLLVTICSSVMAFAQFYVIDNQGDVIFSLSEGLPSYVTFERGQNKSEEIPVDLDLPSGNMWAQCNVGADTPYDFSDFYTHRRQHIL